MCINPSAGLICTQTGLECSTSYASHDHAVIWRHGMRQLSLELGRCPLALELGIGYLTPVLEPELSLFVLC